MEDIGLVYAKGAGDKGQQRQRPEEGRGDLLSDAQDGGGWSLAIPVSGSRGVKLERNACHCKNVNQTFKFVVVEV